METNKYYTPSIEEFHVGFEFEEWENLAFTNEEWTLKKMDYFTDLEYVCFPEVDKHLENYILGTSLFRVKYLDKQDLIEFGFEYTEQYPIILDISENLFVKKSTEFEDFIITMKDNNVNISVKKDVLLMAIPSDKKYWDLYCLFSGKIKNKSELQQVLKMIGVIG